VSDQFSSGGSAIAMKILSRCRIGFGRRKRSTTVLWACSIASASGAAPQLRPTFATPPRSSTRRMSRPAVRDALDLTVLDVE